MLGKPEVLDGYGAGQPYHTGEHDPALVNREDMMRMLLVREILRRVLGDSGLTVDISDYQDDEDSPDEVTDTLIVYATASNGDQAYCDIRSGTPEEQAVFLLDEIGRY